MTHFFFPDFSLKIIFTSCSTSISSVGWISLMKYSHNYLLVYLSSYFYGFFTTIRLSLLNFFNSQKSWKYLISNIHPTNSLTINSLFVEFSFNYIFPLLATLHVKNVLKAHGCFAKWGTRTETANEAWISEQWMIAFWVTRFD